MKTSQIPIALWKRISLYHYLKFKGVSGTITTLPFERIQGTSNQRVTPRGADSI